MTAYGATLPLKCGGAAVSDSARRLKTRGWPARSSPDWPEDSPCNL